MMATIGLTGAGGRLGKRVARALTDAGHHVVGFGRTEPRDPSRFVRWVRGDLASGVPAGSLAGLDALIHAAAATAGGWSDHERDSVGVARQVAQACIAAGVPTLVHVSSMSVLEKRGTEGAMSETTPLADDARRLGPYAWGKTESERVMLSIAAGAPLRLCIVRPGALLDPTALALPGLIGRRVLGRVFAGFGRGIDPIGAIDIETCGRIVARLATHPDEGPRQLNLNDQSLSTKTAVLAYLRRHGWRGTVLWLPIWAVSGAYWAVSTAMRLRAGRGASTTDAALVLRPSAIDYRGSAALVRRFRQDAEA